MGTTPPGPAAPQLDAPGQPVGVAFLGRTSTLVLQDPLASMNRQMRSATEWLPAGWYIAGHYWDVESGGLNLEQRGQGQEWNQFPGADTLPRDGGVADLLAEATSPQPKFSVVVVEDIERSARDMLASLKIEKQLAEQGILLFATDEPATTEGINPTAVLVRRVKQGVAEWYRLQLKGKCWDGLREHCYEGYNIGPAPYGYTADRIPHPAPAKAAQGRTKTRLILDEARAPVVAQIYAWRTVDMLGIFTIANRLNTDPAAYPPPHEAGWTEAGVAAILGNPKYTGYMVYGRRRTINGKQRQMPLSQWFWSPQPVHPVIVDRATWDAAQDIAAQRGNIQDPETVTERRGRYYAMKSRVRCRICDRRMTGSTRTPPAGHDPAAYANYTYYRCPHNPRNPRHAAEYPDHPAVMVREDVLLGILTREFFSRRVFGPDRADLITSAQPATAADQQARRDKQLIQLRIELRRIDNAQAQQIQQIEKDPSPADPAIKAYHDRIKERFVELYHERADIQAKIDALEAAAPPPAGDPTLLDQLPQLPGLLDDAPQKLIDGLLAAFDIQCVYHKKDNQVTIRAVLTDSTPDAVADLLATLATSSRATPATGDEPAAQDDTTFCHSPDRSIVR